MNRLFLLLLLVPLSTWSHSHSHEPAHFKYSKEANEAALEEQAWEEEHGHSHEHHGHSHDYEEDAHGHAHTHGDHADGHGSHGHSHEGGGCPYAGKEASSGGHGHSHGEAAASHSNEGGYTGSLSFMNDARTRLWVHAIGSTLLISIAPFIILFFLPIEANTTESAPMLKVLLAFGSGGLLGDAFLHLIPHAGEEGGHGHSHGGSHGHSHSHGGPGANVGAWVLAGIMAFLCVERLVRVIRGGEGGHGHSHGHSHSKKAKHSDDEEEKEKKDSKKVEKKKGESCDDSSVKSIKIAAYLNLVADFAHNFTDGLAIGASFLAGTTIGFVTMVTVLIHEVPHEIGDFAILIQSGYSRKKAISMQLVTAVGAMSGCVLSLLSADDSLAEAASSSWVLPFTAGGFIYIATVSVLPELLESSSLWQTTKEMIAMFVGIGAMQLISYIE